MIVGRRCLVVVGVRWSLLDGSWLIVGGLCLVGGRWMLVVAGY